MAEQLATGITITFASGFFATVLDVDLDERTREAIRTSHHGTTGAHTFIPSALYDPGGATVELLHDGTKAPPISAVKETVTVQFPDGTGFSVEGFLLGYKLRGPMEDMVQGTARLKFSGVITDDTTPSP